MSLRHVDEKSTNVSLPAQSHAGKGSPAQLAGETREVKMAIADIATTSTD